MADCPNPRCRRKGISFHGYRGSSRLFKCGSCGATTVEITHNSDERLKGNYVTTESLGRIDKEFMEAENERRRQL